MNAPRHQFQLNKRDGKLLGVCAGVADYTGIDAVWVRVGAVLTTIFVFSPLIVVYAVVGWLFKAESADAYLDDRARRFGQRANARPRRSVDELCARYRDADRRLAEFETVVTSRSASLSREIDALR